MSRNSLRRCVGIVCEISVSIIPGAIQFAVMPRRPYSAAIAFVNAAIPPLLPAYADIAASPIAPAIDVMLIMRPYLLRSMWGRASLLKLYGTIILRCIIFCKKTGSDFKNMRISARPALFINTSMRLKFFCVSCISVSSASIAVRSNGIHSGSRPFFGSACNASRIANNFSWLRPVRTVCAPRL